MYMPHLDALYAPNGENLISFYLFQSFYKPKNSDKLFCSNFSSIFLQKDKISNYRDLSKNMMK